MNRVRADGGKIVKQFLKLGELKFRCRTVPTVWYFSLPLIILRTRKCMHNVTFSASQSTIRSVTSKS